jgi:two-component system NarL family sensor kinase
MKQPLCIIAFIIVAALRGTGQTPWATQRDSLLTALTGEKADTNKVWTLITIGAAYMANQPDSATRYAKAAFKLSENLHFPSGMANGLSMQAAILSDQGKPDEALPLDLQAIEIAGATHLPKILANVYNNTAILYTAKGDYNESLDSYLKATAIYEQLNDSSSLAFMYGNLASVYIGLRENKNAYTYSEKGIFLCRRLHQTHGLGSAMVNLGSSLVNLGRYDTALTVLAETEALNIASNDKYRNINVLILLGEAYEGLEKFDLMKVNEDKLMAAAGAFGDKYGMAYAALQFSIYYAHQKEYAKARKWVGDAIKTAKENGLSEVLRYAYAQASKIEVVNGNLAAFDLYDALKDSIGDKLFSGRIVKNTQELEAKYSLNKKQAEIDDLSQQRKIQQLTLRQRNTMNWALAAAALVTALIALLYSRNSRQKKKLLMAGALLQQQRITELERERQLMAAQAVLQGQVEERTRLAKDLHDGLGSILSSAKYSFINMKDNLIITPENAEAFERSMGMLDSSINELRRVAHNMMPEALMKFGLDTALKDFCNSIEQSGAIQLTYQSFEINETSVSAITSAGVYRIIQELVNNILKHADATTALVQLIRKNDALSITVEDNGKGFDMNILQNNKGIGYLNLRNRVAYLKGTLDIQTAPGKGTSVNIEIVNIAA